MCSPFAAQSPSVVIFTVSSTTWLSCLKLAASRLTPTTSSWVTTLIGDTTQWRPWLFSSASRSATEIESPFWEVTTNRAKSPKFTASTTSAWESMAMQTSGNSWLTYLTICLWALALRIKFSVSTEDCPPVSTPSIRSKVLTELLRCLTKVPCATCFGRTQMTEPVGVFHRGERVILSDKISRTNFYKRMV